MKTYTVNHEVERGEDFLKLEIEGTVSAYTSAKLTGHPDTWAPAEGGEVEIGNIYLIEDGEKVKWNGTLTEEEEEKVCQRLQEAAENDDDCDYDPPSGRGDY